MEDFSFLEMTSEEVTTGMPPETDFHADQRSDFKLNHFKQQYKSNLRKLRQEEGLGLPMKMSMELFAVRQVGSQLKDDVLTGRLDTIEFEDFMKRAKRTKEEGQSQAKWKSFNKFF